MKIKVKSLILFSIIFTLLVLSRSLVAQQTDEATIKKLVQEEINRLINSEGALDATIEKGITNYITKQQQAAKQTQIQQQQQLAKNLSPVDMKRDHIFGKQDASITLVEYSDFECPYCKRFHPTVVKLMDNNKDTVRWVYRHFPLDFHNPGAQKQAEASECVAELNGNDAFWKFSDLIYQRTKSNGKGFPVEKLRPLAEEIGIDGSAFSECLDSGRMADRIQADIESGKQVGVSGTPAAFVINQNNDIRIVTGALPLNQLQALVDELSQ